MLSTAQYLLESQATANTVVYPRHAGRPVYYEAMGMLDFRRFMAAASTKDIVRVSEFPGVQRPPQVWWSVADPSAASTVQSAAVRARADADAGAVQGARAAHCAAHCHHRPRRSWCVRLAAFCDFHSSIFLFHLVPRTYTWPGLKHAWRPGLDLFNSISKVGEWGSGCNNILASRPLQPPPRVLGAGGQLSRKHEHNLCGAGAVGVSGALFAGQAVSRSGHAGQDPRPRPQLPLRTHRHHPRGDPSLLSWFGGGKGGICMCPRLGV